jgi:hypothetical protein
MSRWLERLTTAWAELAKSAPVARQFRTMLISTEMALDVFAALRASDNAPCLMLRTIVAPEVLFELGGMRLSQAADPAGSFLVLSLEDQARADLFGTICADVVGAANGDCSDDSLGQFLTRLAAWRRFLRDRRSGLSRAETVGLIGELLVLELILVADRRSLASWKSPDDGLHDFQNEGHALEIKAGLGPSSTITISALDQLDATGVHRLDLLHVKLTEMPEGRCLQDIIASIAIILPDEASRQAFNNALLRRGLMPDDVVARMAPKFQQRSIDAYSVTDAFPRLDRAAIPVAIREATYTIDVRGITTFSAQLSNVLTAFNEGERHE